jgi:hypothetical protein
MPDLVTVQMSSELFGRLQRLAVPLVDDVASVLNKLITHWEASPPKAESLGTRAAQIGSSATSPFPSTAAETWIPPRGGDTLRVGLRLQGSYLGQTFYATVETNGIRFNGELYDSLSAAGVAVKERLGRGKAAASTNGRKFWGILDGKTGRWTSIEDLFPRKTIDTDALLAELDAMPRAPAVRI